MASWRYLPQTTSRGAQSMKKEAWALLKWEEYQSQHDLEMPFTGLVTDILGKN
jgi:hypothetical protein